MPPFEVAWRKVDRGRGQDLVFTSSFKDRKTFGVDVHTGKRRYEFPADGYTPAITDGDRVHLVGFDAVYGLDPK